MKNLFSQFSLNSISICYYLVDIDNNSGHYRPSDKSLQIGIDAFIAAGVISLMK